MTDCKNCIWCKKAGLFNDIHCFSPAFSSAEPIHDWMYTFIGAVGCKTYKEAGASL